MARQTDASERENARISRIVDNVREGVHVGSESHELLFDRFFADGVLTAFRVLNLTDAPHSFTEQTAWEWCRQQSPDDHERLWAGLGFLGQGCHDFLNCQGCRFYEDCQSRNDPRNPPEECGE